METVPPAREDYRIAIICPMAHELAPVEAMMDKVHTSQDLYTLGRIGSHLVAVAVMPETGNNRAAAAAARLRNNFPNIQFGFLIGIGGGIPDEDEYDIRLGDVVVSQPSGSYSGVVQYDFGKFITGGQLQHTGTLRKPPDDLLTLVQRLKSKHIMSGSNELPRFLAEMLKRKPEMRERYIYQGAKHDLLFRESYEHNGGRTCKDCDPNQIINRPSRGNTNPQIHYGVIGSGNAVIKDSKTRDRLRRELGICCVDMEAAGIMDELPCLVVRGICDYADSHKNDRWQPYAAAVAMAYLMELLTAFPVEGTGTCVSASKHLPICFT
jgi:nucleoside phosphorylase